MKWSSRLAYDNKRWLLLKLGYDEELTRLLKITCIIIPGYRFDGLVSKVAFSRSFLFCLTGSSREQIMRLAVQRSISAGSSWQHYSHSAQFTSLEYSYRVVCDDHYYGTGCSNFCRPRDDQFGHYTCDSNGTKTCLDGWKGRYCDQGEDQ